MDLTTNRAEKAYLTSKWKEPKDPSLPPNLQKVFNKIENSPLVKETEAMKKKDRLLESKKVSLNPVHDPEYSMNRVRNSVKRFKQYLRKKR